MTRKTAVFARLGSRPIPRVTRMMGVARDLGVECIYVGAPREMDCAVAETWDGFDVVRVGSYVPLVNGTRLFTYLKGVLRFNRALLQELERRRPTFVHGSDFQVMPACLLHKLRHRTPVLYNIHDNLADRYRVPGAVRAVLNAMEGLAVRLSNQSLVPEEFRRQSLPRWCRSRTVVVRNSPEDTGQVPPSSPDGQVRVLYAGWLDKGRGLDGLLNLARRHKWVELRVAGEGDESIVQQVREAGATYLGFLGHGDIMRESGAAHFVAAFYDPSRIINRAAASNKLAEALSVGRPILINEEVMVSQSPALQGCLVKVPYTEISEIGTRLSDLTTADGGERYVRMCHNARAAYEAEYSWQSVRQQMISVYVHVGLVGAKHG